MKLRSLSPMFGMRGPERLLCLIVAIFTLCAGAPGWATASVSDATNPDAIFLAPGFEEPLVPTAATSVEEDKALSQALKSYRESTTNDDFRPLEEFLKDHPQSGWRIALLTNLGLSYYHRGYFSKTIDVLEEAWAEGRAATEPRAKVLVDRSVGELLWMHARLGHSERLAELFDDIGDRPLTGPATELRTGGKEGLWTMRNDPGVAYLCGPMALWSDGAEKPATRARHVSRKIGLFGPLSLQPSRRDVGRARTLSRRGQASSPPDLS